MSRTSSAVAGFLLLSLFAGFGHAQGKIQIEGADENAVWRIADPKNVTLIEMLEAYSTVRGVSVVYDKAKLGSGETSITGKDLTFQGEEIDLLMANALEGQRLGMFLRGANQYSINPLAESTSLASTMNEKEFEAAKSWQWCTVVVTVEHADANTIRGSIQNLTSRSGGVVQPGRGSVTITERADRLRELIKTVREMDANAATEVKGYDLPEGADAAVAKATLTELFAKDITNRELVISLQEGTSRLLIRARTARHNEVAQAVAALK